LSYEIERWDQARGLAEVWVSIDSVRGNDSTAILMFWGKSDAANYSNSRAVFDTALGYAGVWHLNTGNDATPNANNAVQSASTGPTACDGIMGTAMHFDGIDDYLSVANNPSLNCNGVFTVSFWAKYDAGTVPEYNCIISKKTTWSAPDGFEIVLITGEDQGIDIRTQGRSGWGPLGIINGWSRSEWHFVAIEFNSSSVSIFADGVLTGPSILSVFDGNENLVFGGPAGISPDKDNRKWNGELDEIRLSRRILTQSWLKLCYLNQKADSGLLQFR
jgi:hypothetical protein